MINSPTHFTLPCVQRGGAEEEGGEVKKVNKKEQGRMQGWRNGGCRRRQEGRQASRKRWYILSQEVPQALLSPEGTSNEHPGEGQPVPPLQIKWPTTPSYREHFHTVNRIILESFKRAEPFSTTREFQLSRPDVSCQRENNLCLQLTESGVQCNKNWAMILDKRCP